MIYYILLGASLVISLLAQLFVKSSYGKYKKVANDAGLTGEMVARRILDGNDLINVSVVPVKGELSDHYDPTSRVVRLSEDIFYGSSVASMAVAAHECGHAIQHKEGYSFMKLRSSLVPVVNFVSNVAYIAMIVGIIFELYGAIEVSIIVQFCTLLFQLVTLPVEFNASARALKQLDGFNLFSTQEVRGSRKMLSAAAMTYVAALVSTLLNLLRLLLIFNNNRRRR